MIKTWGYLVAIESEEPLQAAQIEDMLSQWLDDPLFDGECVERINVESMGEITCYEPKEETN